MTATLVKPVDFRSYGTSLSIAMNQSVTDGRNNRSGFCALYIGPRCYAHYLQSTTVSKTLLSMLRQYYFLHRVS